MKKYNILTQSEYNLLKHKNPYFYRVMGDNQAIYYIGVSHVYDPGHPQFAFLLEKWNEFIEQGFKKKKVIVESSLRPFEEDINKAVKYESAAGFITHYATKKEVEILCLEPTKEDELSLLSEKFEMKDVAYYYFSRLAAQYAKQNESKSELSVEDFEKYASSTLRHYAKDFNWKSLEDALSELYSTHERLFGKKFSFENKEFIVRIPWPTLEDSIINKISEESGAIRDNWLVGKIEKLWISGESLFIVYGSAHAVIQEPVIKSFEGAKKL